MADKIIFKRSSILGKRPTTDNLEPGELGLNTNSEEPGAFFSTTDGRVVKVGPTSVSSLPPVKSPERGETWLNLETGSLNVGSPENSWRSIAAPYLGGGGNVVFVAPEYSFSSDSILNDGQTLPYQTLTRAILEIAKRKIKNHLLGNLLTEDEKKYVIYLSPSAVTANNEKGVSADDFSVVFEERTTSEILTEHLTQFNAAEGGIIVPGGISIKGMDLKKCLIKPTYVPSYKHPGLPEDEAGINENLSCILKVAGNSYCEAFSVEDKVFIRNVDSVRSLNSLAVFRSPEPHGLRFNDKVDVRFSPNVDRSTGKFREGIYYVRPLDTFEFQLCSQPLDTENSFGEYVTFSTLPEFEPFSEKKFIVTNTLKSAHRLSVFSYATFGDLAQYYTKVQKAFPVFFGGKVVDGGAIVESSEYEVVAPTDLSFPGNLTSNSTRNSSCYLRHISLRSEYGMAFGDFNGDDISGFRSLIANECTAVSLQKDPAAYEIYTVLTNPKTGQTEQRWWPLIEATYYSLALSERPEKITDLGEEPQMKLLNQTPIENIRYYSESLKSEDGKDLGLVDINKDFRHFGFRARNSAYLQAQSIYTIGPAIGVWSLNGAFIHLTNSTSNFGSIAFKSEGFLGINTIGGAFPNSKNFLFNGIQRPLALSKAQVLDDANKKILSLGSRIIDASLDPADPNTQLLRLSSNFIPCYILPYSLKPGTAVWVSSEGCTYRGYLATDGGPTVILGSNAQCNQGAVLRIRYSDSTIPTDLEAISALDIPYIRRFIDPRSQSDRSYQFVFSNTSTEAIPPPIGSVMRLNQTGQALGTSSLRPNVQFDPGPLGGWGRVFTVDNVQTALLGLSPNYNYIVGNSAQDNQYLVTLTVTDTASPWVQYPKGSGNLPQGSYCTYANKNWYVAENNSWEYTYYNAEFNSTVGQYKIAPSEICSPYVVSGSLERQYPVKNSFQGSYANDPNLTLLPDSIKKLYEEGTYLRGSTVPFSEYAIQNHFDDDDGSESLGLLIKDRKSVSSTFLVSPIDSSAVVKPTSLPVTYGSRRESPQVVTFSVMSSVGIVNPKQDVSVIRVEKGDNFEYMRVISLVGTLVTAIRLDSQNSLYPDPVGGSEGQKPEWKVGEVEPVRVYVCETSSTPVARAYDPDWAHTKYSVLRFFQVMGYAPSAISPLLTPQFWGERLLPIENLSLSPSDDGYARITAKWPIEFNQPSTIIANTHTWAYCGYPSYSQGLPKYQTTEISRKLNYDFLCSTLWSGRLTVTGINEKGELIFFGPQREAVTSQFYVPATPEVNLATQQIFIEPPFVEFPGQVVAYMVDNISSLFDDENTIFSLKRSGYSIPNSHVSANSMWVQLGGITQKPNVDYYVIETNIVFTSPPPKGAYCDIRIVTSEDFEKTLIVVPLVFNEPFDGEKSIFVLSSEPVDPPAKPIDISYLDINIGNTILVLGGVEQLPGSAYSISRLSETELQITFTEAPPKGITCDIRAICSGDFWARQGIFPVAVHSLDSISGEFISPGQTTFELKYEGQPINPSLVNTGNLLVSVGGTMQLPVEGEAGSYEVTVNSEGKSVIKFREPPQPGTTSDLRIVTNAEFLPCYNGQSTNAEFLRWGPSLVLNLAYDLEKLSEQEPQG